MPVVIWVSIILHFKPAIFLVYVLKETDGVPTNYLAQHSQNIVNHLIHAEQLTGTRLGSGETRNGPTINFQYWKTKATEQKVCSVLAVDHTLPKAVTWAFFMPTACFWPRKRAECASTLQNIEPCGSLKPSSLNIRKKHSISSGIKMEVRLQQRTFLTKAVTKQFLCFLQAHKIVVYIV